MDPKVVLLLTWILAGLVVAAYIWFVVWRFRVERRKKAAQEITDGAMSAAIAKTAQQLSATPPRTTPVASPSPDAEALRAELPSVEPQPPPQPQSLVPSSDATVAGLVSGIALPHDLVPLTTIVARAAVGDRVAFWTDRAPAEVVGTAFAGELERLGYTVILLDERTLSAQREHDRLVVMIHPDGVTANIAGQLAFPTVPERSVVIEVWVPA